MKFYKGQKVICIAQKNEWNPIMSDFNESLKLALGVRELPEYNGTYTVDEPMSLFYKGKRYITLVELDDSPRDESAFKPLTKQKENTKEEALRAYSFN